MGTTRKKILTLPGYKESVLIPREYLSNINFLNGKNPPTHVNKRVHDDDDDDDDDDDGRDTDEEEEKKEKQSIESGATSIARLLKYQKKRRNQKVFKKEKEQKSILTAVDNLAKKKGLSADGGQPVSKFDGGEINEFMSWFPRDEHYLIYRLVKYIKEFMPQLISWNPTTLEITVKGVHHSGSNIVDIFMYLYAIHSKYSTQYLIKAKGDIGVPKGTPDFYKTLRKHYPNARHYFNFSEKRVKKLRIYYRDHILPRFTPQEQLVKRAEFKDEFFDDDDIQIEEDSDGAVSEDEGGNDVREKIPRKKKKKHTK